jgi:aminoglycoside 3-N-acetyltransferase
MISYRDILNGLKCLNIDRNRPVIVHASLSSFGEVRGGAETVLGALLTAVGPVMMPTFTYKAMVIPEEGPEENALMYGSGKDTNRMGEFYSVQSPADPMMGVIAEKLRQLPAARRSTHPILSFAGIGVDEALKAQTLDEPLRPIGKLAAEDGWVLLLGVNQTVNTSLHYGEYLAGRRQFIRWALTPQGVRACPGFPGCSDGFEAVSARAAGFIRTVKIGNAHVQAMPLTDLINMVMTMIQEDPLALLCQRPDCERCDAVRKSIRAAYN